MEHNVHSMKTQLTQNIFHFRFDLTDQANFGLIDEVRSDDLPTYFVSVEKDEEKRSISFGSQNLTQGSRDIMLLTRDRTTLLATRYCNNFNKNTKDLSLL